MKFNSKLLLEELIRTHILEAAGDVVVDMNVNRGKPVASQSVYGNINNPGSGTSFEDEKMFDDIFIELFNKFGNDWPRNFKYRNKINRPYLKLYTDVKGKTDIPESERISVVTNVASTSAADIISRFGETGDGVDQYDAIISNPQKAKLTSSSNSTKQQYSGTDKLYYTIVYLRKTDINDTITPKWGTNNGIKYYSQDQITQLKSAVKPEPEAEDDVSSLQSNTSRELTTKNQLTNIGFSTDESKKDLQRTIYSWWQANKAGASAEIVDIFNKFKKDYDVNADPADWNGIITTDSDVVEIINNFYNITDPQDFLEKLRAMPGLVKESLKESIRQKIKNFRKSKLIEQSEDTPNPWDRTNTWWAAELEAQSQAETEKAEEAEEAEKEQKNSVLSDNPEIQKTDTAAVYSVFSNTYEEICADLKNFFQDHDQFAVYKSWNPLQAGDDEYSAWEGAVIPFLKRSVYSNFKKLTTILTDLGLQSFTIIDVGPYMGNTSITVEPPIPEELLSLHSELDLPIQRMIENYLMLKSNIDLNLVSASGEESDISDKDTKGYYNFVVQKGLWSLIHQFLNPGDLNIFRDGYVKWEMPHWGSNGEPVVYIVETDF
jgi:hypothetical protein